MENLDAKTAFAGKEVATMLMLRQLYTVVNNQLGGGTDGLLALRDDLIRQLDEGRAANAFEEVALQGIQIAGKATIRGVFAPLIGETPE